METASSAGPLCVHLCPALAKSVEHKNADVQRAAMVYTRKCAENMDEEQVSWRRGDLDLELGDLGEIARLVGDEEHELVRAGKLLEESCLCLRRRARHRHPSVS